MAVGMLLTRGKKDTKNWLSDRTSKISIWLKKQRSLSGRNGSFATHGIRSGIHKQIDKNIPDPYRATEHIALEERDMLGI